MPTIEEIKNEVENLTEILKNIKTLEDCTLDTLEADYNRAIYEAVHEDRFID